MHPDFGAYNNAAGGAAKPGELLLEIDQQTATGFDKLAKYQGYDALGLPHSTIDAAGQVTGYTYAAGRVETVTRMRNGAAETTTYAYYDAAGAGNLGNAFRLHTIKGPE